DIREGIRRIGRVLAQQVRLLGTLSGSLRTAAAIPAPDPAPAGIVDPAPAGIVDPAPAGEVDREPVTESGRTPAAKQQRTPEESGRAPAVEESAGEGPPLAGVVALPRRQDQGSVRRR